MCSGIGGSGPTSPKYFFHLSAPNLSVRSGPSPFFCNASITVVSLRSIAFRNKKVPYSGTMPRFDDGSCTSTSVASVCPDHTRLKLGLNLLDFFNQSITPLTLVTLLSFQPIQCSMRIQLCLIYCINVAIRYC